MASSTKNPFDNDKNEEKVVGWGVEDEEEDPYEAERRRILEQRRQIEERSLKSTQRSMGYIDDSEKIGVHTAQELVEQREQLTRVAQNLDKMNDDLNTSQRHLNSIKSIFGSIGNYFKKNSNAQSTSGSEPSKKSSSSALEATLQQQQQNRVAAGGGSGDGDASDLHPGLRVHSDYVPPTQEQQQQNKPKSYDEAINQNLDDMSEGMGRLRGLALGMQRELDEQDEVLDTLTNKVDKVEPKIGSQNRQMRRLLK